MLIKSVLLAVLISITHQGLANALTWGATHTQTLLTLLLQCDSDALERPNSDPIDNETGLRIRPVGGSLSLFRRVWFHSVLLGRSRLQTEHIQPWLGFWSAACRRERERIKSSENRIEQYSNDSNSDLWLCAAVTLWPVPKRPPLAINSLVTQSRRTHSDRRQQQKLWKETHRTETQMHKRHKFAYELCSQIWVNRSKSLIYPLKMKRRNTHDTTASCVKKNGKMCKLNLKLYNCSHGINPTKMRWDGY